MVRGHAVRADALGQQMREPLGEPPRVHEDERGAVLLDVRGDPVEDLAPLLVGRHGLQLAPGQLDGEVERAPVAEIDDPTARRLVRATGRSVPAPTRRWAMDSIGRCVAESPMRCGRSPHSASSRSSVSMRCAPRLSRATAWISSTMTVLTRRRRSRLFAAVTSR